MSLVEMLLVIVIGGLLIVIFFSFINKARSFSREQGEVTEINQLFVAVKNYAQSRSGTLPKNDFTLDMETKGFITKDQTYGRYWSLVSMERDSGHKGQVDISFCVDKTHQTGILSGVPQSHIDNRVDCSKTVKSWIGMTAAYVISTQANNDRTKLYPISLDSMNYAPQEQMIDIKNLPGACTPDQVHFMVLISQVNLGGLPITALYPTVTDGPSSKSSVVCSKSSPTCNLYPHFNYMLMGTKDLCNVGPTNPCSSMGSKKFQISGAIMAFCPK